VETPHEESHEESLGADWERGRHPERSEGSLYFAFAFALLYTNANTALKSSSARRCRHKMHPLAFAVILSAAKDPEEANPTPTARTFLPQIPTSRNAQAPKPLITILLLYLLLLYLLLLYLLSS
jgi:hypothetical protein